MKHDAIQDLFEGATSRVANLNAPLHRTVRPGRGVASQPTPRFAECIREAVVDDGLCDEDLPPSRVPTHVTREQSRSIISRNQSPDVPFDQSVNPYRGCEHGCVYCYARPSHSYLDLSPGLDFETRLYAKTNAAALLEKELMAPNYVCSPINLGANTDPYQPVERTHSITRQLLEVFDRLDHPLTLITKGALIQRDLDILERLAARRLVSVAISVTTLDNGLKRTLEPRTASPASRLNTIRALRDRGIPVTLLLAPVIPALNDHEIERIVHAAAEAGVSSARYIFLRLPLEVKELFAEWLIDHYPLRARHVLNLIGEARDGTANSTTFGERMIGSGPYAKMIQSRFDKAVKAAGLDVDSRLQLNTDLFVRHHPAQAQLSLL
ncbi:MAG: PA0069 family radical SAM protein [Pseudomonadota bacterium]